MPHEALQDGKRPASCIRTWAEMQTAAEQFKCSSRKECEMRRRSGFRNGRPAPFPARSVPGAAWQPAVPSRSGLTRSAPGQERWMLPRRRGGQQEDMRTAGGGGGQQAEESDAASGLPGSRMAREHGYCPFFLDCIGCASFRAVHARGRHGAERQAAGYPAFALGKQGWAPETTQPKLQGGRSMPCLDEGRSRRAAPQAEACRERRIP